jgi:hypothetical protein
MLTVAAPTREEAKTAPKRRTEMFRFKTFPIVLVAAAVLWLGAPYSGAAIVTMNFDDAGVGPGQTIDATAYLASYGITLSNVYPSGQSGVVEITNWGSDGGWAYDTFLYQDGAGAPPCGYTLNFATPLLSISFTRMETPHDLSYIPEWSATAYVGSTPVGSVGNGGIEWSYGGTPDRNFTLSGDGITSLAIYAYGHYYTGIGSVPLEDFVMTQVPEPATVVVWSLLGGLAIIVGRRLRKRD